MDLIKFNALLICVVFYAAENSSEEIPFTNENLQCNYQGKPKIRRLLITGFI